MDLAALAAKAGREVLAVARAVQTAVSGASDAVRQLAGILVLGGGEMAPVRALRERVRKVRINPATLKLRRDRRKAIKDKMVRARTARRIRAARSAQDKAGEDKLAGDNSLGGEARAAGSSNCD